MKKFFVLFLAMFFASCISHFTCFTQIPLPPDVIWKFRDESGWSLIGEPVLSSTDSIIAVIHAGDDNTLGRLYFVETSTGKILRDEIIDKGPASPYPIYFINNDSNFIQKEFRIVDRVNESKYILIYDTKSYLEGSNIPVDTLKIETDTVDPNLPSKIYDYLSYTVSPSGKYVAVVFKGEFKTPGVRRVAIIDLRSKRTIKILFPPLWDEYMLRFLDDSTLVLGRALYVPWDPNFGDTTTRREYFVGIYDINTGNLLDTIFYNKIRCPIPDPPWDPVPHCKPIGPTCGLGDITAPNFCTPFFYTSRSGRYVLYAAVPKELAGKYFWVPLYYGMYDVVARRELWFKKFTDLSAYSGGGRCIFGPDDKYFIMHNSLIVDVQTGDSLYDLGFPNPYFLMTKDGKYLFSFRDYPYGYMYLRRNAYDRLINEVEEPTPLEGTIIPNPTDGRATLEFEQRVSLQTKIVVTSTEGNVLFTVFDGLLPQGRQRFEIPTAHLASGIYFVVVTTQQQRWAYKLVVTK
jgi:hypothetical protein